MATGQNPNDPLTVLNGPMGHGLMAGFNPFQGMGVNMNDPNMVRQNTSVVSNSQMTRLVWPTDAKYDELSGIRESNVSNHGRSRHHGSGRKNDWAGITTPCPSDDAKSPVPSDAVRIGIANIIWQRAYSA